MMMMMMMMYLHCYIAKAVRPMTVRIIFLFVCLGYIIKGLCRITKTWTKENNRLHFGDDTDSSDVVESTKSESESESKTT